jgi:hypothetical protein
MDYSKKYIVKTQLIMNISVYKVVILLLTFIFAVI